MFDFIIIYENDMQPIDYHKRLTHTIVIKTQNHAQKLH